MAERTTHSLPWNGDTEETELTNGTVEDIPRSWPVRSAETGELIFIVRKLKPGGNAPTLHFDADANVYIANEQGELVLQGGEEA